MEDTELVPMNACERCGTPLPIGPQRVCDECGKCVVCHQEVDPSELVDFGDDFFRIALGGIGYYISEGDKACEDCLSRLRSGEVLQIHGKSATVRLKPR